MSSLCFGYPLHGILLDEKRSFIEKEFTRESEEIATIDGLVAGECYDYYFYKNIIILPGIAEKDAEAIKITASHWECQLDGMDDFWLVFNRFLIFFAYQSLDPENENSPLLISSLNLPDRQFVKSQLRIKKVERKNTIIHLMG